MATGWTDGRIGKELGRARETAEASSRVLGLEMKIHVDLRERHFGVLSELTLSEAEARHP